VNFRDYFVAGVAIGIGILALASAAGFPGGRLAEQALQLRSVRAIESRWGESAARMVLLLVATVMLATGVAIIADSRPAYRWKNSQPDAASR
jgi:hypothetical protein